MAFPDTAGDDRFSRFPKLQKATTEIIANMAKVRSALGTELAMELSGVDEDEMWVRMKEAGFERPHADDFSTEECTAIREKIILYLKLLPDVEWDDELLSDVLFVDLSVVHKALFEDAEITSWGTYYEGEGIMVESTEMKIVRVLGDSEE
jgi:hypothetical protein